MRRSSRSRARPASSSAPSFERRTYLERRFGPGPLPAPVTPGIDPEREPRIHDLTLTFGQGLGSAGDPNALVSATLAREDGLSIGSRLGIEGIDEPVYLRIGGILAGDGPGGANGWAVITTLPIARSVFGADAGGATRVDLEIADGIDSSA